MFIYIYKNVKKSFYFKTYHAQLINRTESCEKYQKTTLASVKKWHMSRTILTSRIIDLYKVHTIARQFICIKKENCLECSNKRQPFSSFPEFCFAII